MNAPWTRRRFVHGGVALALAGQARAQSVPWSAFGATSTAKEVTAGIDLAGKTAVVTGCNSGIGAD